MSTERSARCFACWPLLGVLLLVGGVVAGTLVASAGAARADSSPYLQRENPLRSLLPTPEARAERAEAELERKLERLLAQQPGIAHAHVEVSLPAAASAPLEQPLPQGRAALVVTTRDDRTDLTGLTELTRGLLPPGTEVQLARVGPQASAARARQAGQPSPAVGPAGRVGPFRVDGKSVGLLRATLAGLLVSNALLAALLLWSRARR